MSPITQKVVAKSKRRPSKPVTKSKTIPRHHILIDCQNESMQRELFEHLRKLGVPCRLLVL
jgi:hypothetical protein